jgi:hypothetical protein
MSTPAPPSPLALYLQSGLTASSGVDAALLNAGPSGGNMGAGNVLTEEMQNLALPANQSLFSPASYWDYTNPAQYSQDPTVVGITATGTTTGASAIATALSSFSLFGLSTPLSLLLVAGVVLLLTARHSGHGHGHKRGTT